MNSGFAAGTLSLFLIGATATATVPPTAAVTPSGDVSPTQLDEVEQARLLLANKKPQDALELIAPIIAKAEGDPDAAKDPNAICPAVAVGVLTGLMQAQGQSISVTVGNDWCEAMLIKGYALIELDRKSEAVTTLARLVGHDGKNPNYLNEYAYALRVNGQVDQAYDTYRRAEGVATALVDRNAAKRWRAAALRGIGYIYIERQQWDEAIKAYKKSLKDDPNSEVAKRELDYIERNRPVL